MTELEDHELNDSIKKLNDTALSLTELVRIVDKNQTLLVENQQATLDNTDAISLRSTKIELITEIKHFVDDRQKMQRKNKFILAVTFLITLSLIGSLWITTNRYNKAGLEAANIAALVCHERGDQANATRKFYQARALQVENDPKITELYRAEQLALFKDLLEHFVPVDCTVLNRTAEKLNTNASIQDDMALLYSVK